MALSFDLEGEPTETLEFYEKSKEKIPKLSLLAKKYLSAICRSVDCFPKQKSFCQITCGTVYPTRKFQQL